MLNNYFRSFIFTMLLAIIAGCSSVKIATKFNGQKIEPTGATPVAHILADNFGYYLFNCVPLITGNPSKPGSTCLFQNKCKVKPVVAMLTKKSKKLGATKTTNIKTTVDQTGAYSLWIFWYRDVQASGNAVK